MRLQSHPWQSYGPKARNVSSFQNLDGATSEDSMANTSLLRPEFFREISPQRPGGWPSLLERLQRWAENSPDGIAFKTWEGSGFDRSMQVTSLTWSRVWEQLSVSQLMRNPVDPRPIVLALQNSGLAPMHILEVWCADRCLIPLALNEPEVRVVELLRSLPSDVELRCSAKPSGLTASTHWTRLGFVPMGSSSSEDLNSNSESAPVDLASTNWDEDSAQLNPGVESVNLWMNAVLTSGSTGFSKLVPQTRGQVFANAEALARRLKLKSGDRILTPLPLYHVNALNFALLTSVMIGAEVHFTHALPIKSLLSTISQVHPRFVSLIPPLLRQLQACSDDELRAAFKSTEAVVTAATALAPDLYEFWVKKIGIQVIQGYGLSESVNFSCLTPLQPSYPYRNLIAESRSEGVPSTQSQRFVSIGTALDGTEVSIRDQQDQELPPGTVGEICLRGYSVMNGYWNVPEADQPMRNNWLRTGDLGFEVVQLDGQSTYFHAGRIKEVMKRSGETISLIEVDFKINSEFARDLGESHRSQLEQLGVLDFMSVGFAHAITGEELGLVVRIDAQRLREVGKKNWLVQTDVVWKSALQGVQEKFRPRVLLYVEDELRTASGKPQRWKRAADFEAVRNLVMTKDFKVVWSSQLTLTEVD